MEAHMRLTRILAACALAVTAATPARAQFTAVVAPRPARVDSPTVAPATIAQQRDSAARVTMTNMRDWVDSAVATLGNRIDSVVVDTAAAVVVEPPAAAVAPERPRPEPTERFREGAAAPDTATPLPLIGLTGIVLLVAGLWLLRRRECEEQSARP
jgi:hypothetical protein